MKRKEHEQINEYREKRNAIRRRLREKRFQEEHELLRELDELESEFKDSRFKHRQKPRYHDRDFEHYSRRFRYTRPISLILVLALWFLLFWYGGVSTGLGIVVLVFAIIMTAGSIFQILFLMGIEKRILKPIDELKKGVGEIAQGNYNIEVKYEGRNEISRLIDDFNSMAKKLAESERLKNEYEENRKLLIANISHDLKTPMTSILGYIEAIHDTKNLRAQKGEKYLKIISGNIKYMNRLIDDLFLFSKLDMQKLAFDYTVIDIRPFMRDLTEEFKLELEEKHIELRYAETLTKDRKIKIDPKRFHQVMLNLIDNAVKYGPENGLIIQVLLKADESSIHIDLRDNGPGIPAENLGHVFERFYRLDLERTKDIASTGLGLAIAKELIEMQGGAIGVQSTLNEGTCFSISLPVWQDNLR